jgi:hypothetical protein
MCHEPADSQAGSVAAAHSHQFMCKSCRLCTAHASTDHALRRLRRQCSQGSEQELVTATRISGPLESRDRSAAGLRSEPSLLRSSVFSFLVPQHHHSGCDYNFTYLLIVFDMPPKRKYNSTVSDDTGHPSSSQGPVHSSSSTHPYGEPPAKKGRKAEGANPAAPAPEKRGARVRSSCPKAIMDRVDRVMSQRYAPAYCASCG